jgi:hypothetical protein
MKVLTKILAGGIGLAALASAAPAAAQYYPQPYPNYSYGQYGYGNQNPVGQILGQILGYGRYPYGNYGYNQYSNQSSAVDQCARAVEARLNGYNNGYYGYGNVPYGGQYGYGQYGQYGQYGYNNRYNMGARVQGITRVDRKSYGLKVYGVASSGYQGYDGYGRRGYGSYGYNAGADLSWKCEVRYDGRIRDIDINRREANWRGY